MTTMWAETASSSLTPVASKEHTKLQTSTNNSRKNKLSFLNNTVVQVSNELNALNGISSLLRPNITLKVTNIPNLIKIILRSTIWKKSNSIDFIQFLQIRRASTRYKPDVWMLWKLRRIKIQAIFLLELTGNAGWCQTENWYTKRWAGPGLE